MLASQLGLAANAVAFPEMQFVHRLLNAEYRQSRSVEQAYKDLVGHFRFRAAGLKMEKQLFIRAYESSSLAEVICSLIKQNAPHLADAKEVVWIEHNPHNRDGVMDLLNAFPEALFVHIYRDPRAVYWSMKSNPRWKYGEPSKFANLWNDAVSKCYLYAQQLTDRCLEICYEDYVSHPQEQLIRLCEFVRLPYQESMLNGGGVRLPGYTEQQHKLTTKPADVSRIGRWQGRLSELEESYIKVHCYDWMRQYGYLTEQRQIRKFRGKEKLQFYFSGLKAKWQAKFVRGYQNRMSV